MIQEASHLAEWEDGDIIIAERLIRAYKITMSQENTFPVPDDLWSRISGESRIQNNFPNIWYLTGIVPHGLGELVLLTMLVLEQIRRKWSLMSF
jgi:hypothetical protein